MFFRYSPFFLLIIMLSACSELPYNNLDNKQLKTMLEQSVPIYDVRRPDEWRQTGIIKGSQLLTFVDAGGRVKADFLARFTAAVDKDDPVILSVAPAIAPAIWHATWLKKCGLLKSITYAMVSLDGSAMDSR